MEYTKFIETISDVFNVGYSYTPVSWMYSDKNTAEHENDRVTFRRKFYKDNTPNKDVQIDVVLMNWKTCKQFATFYCLHSDRYFVVTDDNNGQFELQENLDNEEIKMIREGAKQLRPLLAQIKNVLKS